MSDEHIRSFDSRGLQQRVKLIRVLPHRTRDRTGITPRKSSEIEATHTRKVRHIRLDQSPIEREITAAWDEYYGRFAFASTVEMQTIATDIYKLTGRRNVLLRDC